MLHVLFQQPRNVRLNDLDQTLTAIIHHRRREIARELGGKGGGGKHGSEGWTSASVEVMSGVGDHQLVAVMYNTPYRNKYANMRRARCGEGRAPDQNSTIADTAQIQERTLRHKRKEA